MFTGFSELIVYLVELSATQGRIITTLLGQVGVLQVHRCANAAEALSRMREALPSVVISALYLPDIWGTELVHAMRIDADLEHVTFILVSSETRPQVLDLVVTDYNMPEMDGKALVDHIRTKSWQNSVPVLMVTSESNQGRLAAVEEAGVSGICDKRFEPAVVKALLRKILQPD